MEMILTTFTSTETWGTLSRKADDLGLIVYVKIVALNISLCINCYK